MIEDLLSRLTKVKGRAGNWTACCPAHADKSPSLAIKEQDGKILLRCFAGCEVSAIVGAVGLDMTDLFPPRPQEYGPQPKVKFYATDLLRCIAMEASIVAVLARDIGKGAQISPQDRARALLACERINTAMEASQ